MPRRNRSRTASPSEPLTLAVPKGRILRSLAALFDRASIGSRRLLEDDRSLVRLLPAAGLRILLLKPDDVPTYVEHGAAQLGFVGRDVLLEHDPDVRVPLDLGIGRCRMVVAASRADALSLGNERTVLRVATKYPNIARRYFMQQGRAVDTIFVQGSVEIAPLAGLSDVVVDLVETGETLRRNGLVEIDTIHEVATVAVVNRVASTLDAKQIRPLLARLAQAAGGTAPRPR